MSELRELCEKLGITIVSKSGASEAAKKLWKACEVNDRPWPCTEWTVTLKLEGRKVTIPYRMGLGIKGDPDVADVVSSLVLEARSGEMSFEDFASDFGFDPDSRSAEAVWKSSKKIAPKVRKFLGEHFDEIERAEH